MAIHDGKIYFVLGKSEVEYFPKTFNDGTYSVGIMEDQCNAVKGKEAVAFQRDLTADAITYYNNGAT